MDITHRFLEQLIDEYWLNFNTFPAGSVESNGTNFMLYYLRYCRNQPIDYITGMIRWMIKVSLDPRQYAIIRENASPERADAAKEIHMRIVQRLIIYLDTIGIDTECYRSQQQAFLQNYLQEVSA